MIALVWKYVVADHAQAAFEQTYSPTGAWAQLFRRSDGFVGTELLKGEDGAYITIDRWRTRADFDAFMVANHEQYTALDRSTEAWASSEQRIGEFQVCQRD